MSNEAGTILERLAASGKPGLARASAPWDEASVFEVLKRAADEQRLRASRRYLVGLERLLERFPHAESRPSWRASPQGVAPGPGEALELLGYRGDATLVDASRYLPKSEHETFAAYTAYLDELGPPLGFQSPGIEAICPELCVGLRTLVKSFLCSAPLRRAYLNVFFGNYRSTPFGVHVDAHHEHVFHLVLSGSKTLWAWNAFDLALLDDPAAVLGTSPPNCNYPVPPTRLTARPGEVLYWPGHYAHCMVTDGPSMGVSLVLQPPEPDPEQALLSIGLAERRAGAALCLKPRGTDAARTLDDAVAVAALRCRSIGGLIHVGPRRALGPDGEVEGILEPLIDPDFPIATLELSDGRLAVAMNGLSFEWNDPASVADLRRMLDEVNRMPPRPARELYARFVTARLQASDVTAVLRFCTAAAAVRIRP